MKSPNRNATSSTQFATKDIVQAATWLVEGKLLAYPTESVWGIGCDPFNKSAVMQLLALKQRPIDKGMIVITDRVERIAPLLTALNDKQRQSVMDSWQPVLNHQFLHTQSLDTQAVNKPIQQAQTWLLPLPVQLKITMPSWITGRHDSIAVRVIAHPLIQQLCAQMVSADNPYGFIVSTSCNPSGESPALNLEQAQAYFSDTGLASNVRYLAGKTLEYQLPSQISDALTGQVIR